MYCINYKNHKCVKMVVSQANPVDPASDIEKPNTDWNKVEISFKKKDFQVTTEIRFVMVLIRKK